MPLIYCGIDEAGYGPTLGPLCVALSIFRVDGWNEGEPAPDLWSMLSRAVCRKTNDKRRRLAVDDSKKLKLANSSVNRHPCYHLERGVLSFLTCRSVASALPVSDLAMLEALGVPMPAENWYAGDAHPAPVGCSADQLAIDANVLRTALSEAGISLLRLGCQALSESVFNELVEAAGTKAAATELAWTTYLSEVWQVFCGEQAVDPVSVRVVCDRQGGRAQYGGILTRIFPDSDVLTIGETATVSKYDVICRLRPTFRMSVIFKTEAESAHMPVALASMTAKLVRETMMARFNRYWCGRIPELKPTAGYALDASRWLSDVREVLSPQERRSLIRRA